MTKAYKKTKSVRKKRKHHYKIGDCVDFKFVDERMRGRVRELRTTKDGYASYYVQATYGRRYDIGLDKDQPHGWIDSELTSRMKPDMKAKLIKEIILPNEKKEDIDAGGATAKAVQKSKKQSTKKISKRKRKTG